MIRFTFYEKIILILIAIAAGTAAYCGLFLPIVQDEGVFLTVGKVISGGQLPYIDIFDHKSPGIYYLLAGLMGLFGDNIFAFRIFMLVISIIVIILLYLFGKLIWSKEIGILAGLVYAISFFIFEGNLILTESLAGLGILAAFLFWAIYQKNKGIKWIFLAGIMGGAGLLFKQTALLPLTVLGLLIIVDRKRDSWTNIGLFILGVGIVWLPWLSFFLIFDAENFFFYQVLWLNLTNYPMILGGKKITEIIAATLTLLPIWITLVIYIVYFVRKLLREGKKYLVEISIILILVAILPNLIYRSYLHYWLMILPFVALGSGWGWKKLIEVETRTNLGRIKISFISLTILLFSVLSAGNFINSTRDKLPIKDEQIALARYIEKNTSRDDKIYSSRFFTGAYFMSNRKPASKYIYLSEINAPEDAEQITAQDLKAIKPKYIVWNMEDPISTDPYTKKIRLVIQKNYLLEKYYPFLKLGLYKFSAQ